MTVRPGAGRCARCHEVFAYAVMVQARVNSYKRPHWMCRECRDRLLALRMLARW